MKRKRDEKEPLPESKTILTQAELTEITMGTTGFDCKVFAVEPPHDYKCPVCLDVCRDAVDMECGSGYMCSACRIKCNVCPMCSKITCSTSEAHRVRLHIGALPTRQPKLLLREALLTRICTTCFHLVPTVDTTHPCAPKRAEALLFNHVFDPVFRMATFATQTMEYTTFGPNTTDVFHAFGGGMEITADWIELRIVLSNLSPHITSVTFDMGVIIATGSPQTYTLHPIFPRSGSKFEGTRDETKTTATVDIRAPKRFIEPLPPGDIRLGVAWTPHLVLPYEPVTLFLNGRTKPLLSIP